MFKLEWEEKIGCLLIVVLFILVLIIHAQYYLPFISDDSLISLRYARRFLEGHGLSWTDGRPVEGYSNLLWILLVSMLGAINIDLIDATRILGIFCMSGIIIFWTWWYISKVSLQAAWYPLVVAFSFFSLSATVAVWTVGGLEQPLYAILLAVSLSLIPEFTQEEENKTNKLLMASFILGLLCLTRPDGPIFTAAAVLTIFICKPAGFLYNLSDRAKKAVLLSFFPFVFCGGQLIFRIIYYKDILPNTAYVKISPSFASFINGLTYFRDGIIATAPLSIIAIIILFTFVLLKRTRVHILYACLTFLFWSLYVVFIGGDIFPAYRQMLPLIVIFVYIIIEGLIQFVFRSSFMRSRRNKVVALFILLAVLAPYLHSQFTKKEYRRANFERWEWDGKSVGLFLKRAFSNEQPLVAVTAAGCIPYWSELPALDMMGLNDYYLPRHPPEDRDINFIGHELGDAEYVLKRNPGIIVFHVGIDPIFRSGLEMKNKLAFHQRYEPIMVKTETRDFTAKLYFNKYSQHIGILYQKDRIIVPGYLFKNPEGFVKLNKNHKAVSVVPPKKTLHITFRNKLKYSEKFKKIKFQSSGNHFLNADVWYTAGKVLVTIKSTAKEPVQLYNVILFS